MKTISLTILAASISILAGCATSHIDLSGAPPQTVGIIRTNTIHTASNSLAIESVSQTPTDYIGKSVSWIAMPTQQVAGDAEVTWLCGSHTTDFKTDNVYYFVTEGRDVSEQVQKRYRAVFENKETDIVFRVTGRVKGFTSIRMQLKNASNAPTRTFTLRVPVLNDCRIEAPTTRSSTEN